MVGPIITSIQAIDIFITEENEFGNSKITGIEGMRDT